MNVASKFELLTATQLEALPDLEWLIPSILPKPSLAILYGAPGCGKTFAALSMALSVASGDNWLGRQCVATAVLYIAAEGVLGLKSRIAAHRSVRGPVGQKIRFLPGAPNLLESGDLEALATALEAAGLRPGLIVVDTLARVTTGADENNARDMGEAVAALDTLREAYDATVLVLHHKTKSGGSERGSSALRGAADVMIECTGEDHADGRKITITCTKMKDDEDFANLAVLMRRIDLGGGRSSLALAGELAVSEQGSQRTNKLEAIFKDKFPDGGARNKELKEEWALKNNGSTSTFQRALKDALDSGACQAVGEGKDRRYDWVGVSVTSVSP
ncbi:MAG: helicase RepA family protein [Boseongicola sp.]|nr:helicase RepA family protein [Boseongicola sp.]